MDNLSGDKHHYSTLFWKDLNQEANTTTTIIMAKESNNKKLANVTAADVEEEDDSKTFPMKLMEILADEQYGESICWLPHGRAFTIRNRKLFAEKVMPLHFSRKAKYSSFTRKLNRW